MVLFGKSKTIKAFGRLESLRAGWKRSSRFPAIPDFGLPERFRRSLLEARLALLEERLALLEERLAAPKSMQTIFCEMLRATNGGGNQFRQLLGHSVSEPEIALTERIYSFADFLTAEE